MSFNPNQERHFSELERQALKDYFERPKNVDQQLNQPETSITQDEESQSNESVKTN